MSSVICIESESEDDLYIVGEVASKSDKSPSPVKRVKPTKVVSGNGSAENEEKPRTSVPEKKRSSKGAFKRTRLMKLSDNLELSDDNSSDGAERLVPAKTEEIGEKTKFPVEFRRLVQTCKATDSSPDMDKLIRKKLVAYYRDVPPEFTSSRVFKDLVIGVTDEIKKSPHLIYLKITRIVEELKPRRIQQAAKRIKKEPEEAADVPEIVKEKDTKKTAQIRKLNKALVKLKQRIDELDKEEVDFDEDVNSSHMKVERYKKRACQIYEKLCEISGENKHAQRSSRAPIKFHGTVYPEFNRTLQAFVNRSNIFPDFFDVKRTLEHCVKVYDLRLSPEEIKTVAQDAFVKVGRILQKRRKIDLYEMVSYFVGTDGDPADEDSELQAKLTDNKQYHSKIGELIDKFADDEVRCAEIKPATSENGQSDPEMNSIEIKEECPDPESSVQEVENFITATTTKEDSQEVDAAIDPLEFMDASLVETFDEDVLLADLPCE